MKTYSGSLSRARESGKSEAFIGVIYSSNKIASRERLNERVDSSLQDNELVFEPYDATQLKQILEHRRDAFELAYLMRGSFPRLQYSRPVNMASRERPSTPCTKRGQLAEKAGDASVIEAHVDDALRQAVINRFQKLVSGQPPHVKYILRALAVLTESHDQTDFRTAEVYDAYERVASQVGTDPLSYDRVQRLLKEQAFLGITESEHTGDGPGEGSYRIHWLLRSVDVVVEALNES